MKLVTPNGFDAFVCISSMQKCIRRAIPGDATKFAFEVAHESKRALKMVLNRLRVISQEDIGVANPTAIPFVETCCVQAELHWDRKKEGGEWRLCIANAILFMCRGDKTREGCHLNAASWFSMTLDKEFPDVPDCARDMHTTEGKKMGRGIKHFREEGSKLVPQPDKDEFEDKAYGYWERLRK